jgi:HD superfamily phosphohydrolase
LKRIFDPIHHFIELDDAEVALLDTPPIQRLRRLRQLGFAYFAFPSAEHSRFSHALGALAMAERAMAQLRRVSPEYFASDHDYALQRRLLRVSALVHDVGHGPFSHASEAVLGMKHELRTRAILELPEMREALSDADVDVDDVIALILGRRDARFPILRELVSGPNLDVDRMDYLQRDAYFTGVAGGTYDGEQLVTSLCVVTTATGPCLGVDGRGIVALESFALARYMMFSRVYFHHTTRMFERALGEALAELWPDPRSLDPVTEYLEWDDFRVLDAFRTKGGEAGEALRHRTKLYGLVAEFNADSDTTAFKACLRALRDRFGKAIWPDEKERLIHGWPNAEVGHTVPVKLSNAVVDAVDASEIIKRLAGMARWRKIFIRMRASGDLAEARDICRTIVSYGPLSAQ